MALFKKAKNELESFEGMKKKSNLLKMPVISVNTRPTGKNHLRNFVFNRWSYQR